ncbi:MULTISPECIES: hypothetical protein [Burkholderia]|uniref:hypothetical protein n=1 Tax=Burkholderia TaxID=32008 RepID=UPI001F078477|nr:MULTISPECIES: hypothetical protein [Burkholderia]
MFDAFEHAGFAVQFEIAAHALDGFAQFVVGDFSFDGYFDDRRIGSGVVQDHGGTPSQEDMVRPGTNASPALDGFFMVRASRASGLPAGTGLCFASMPDATDAAAMHACRNGTGTKKRRIAEPFRIRLSAA